MSQKKRYSAEFVNGYLTKNSGYIDEELDTNQASELFELCKEVYKRFPEWNDTLAVYEQTAGIPEGKPYIAYPELERKWGLWGTQELKKHIPLYTSDYLLEKLPSSIESKEYPGKRAVLWTRKEDDHLDPEGRITYFAWYFVTGVVDGVSDFGVHADTPLKALLKLTLELHRKKML